jgi:hypothetical protein
MGIIAELVVAALVRLFEAGDGGARQPYPDGTDLAPFVLFGFVMFVVAVV